jgi:dipeptidyl aminopeptidase/acylaminoacyl peptidase
MHNLLGNSPSDSLIEHFSNETQVSGNTPPAFLVQSLDDGAVPFENSILYAQALRKHNINAELHLYQQGGHGYGLAKNNKGTERGWPDACLAWLRLEGIIN